MSTVIVNSKNEVVDVLESGVTFSGLNPDYTVYQCDAVGTEKTLEALPAEKTDVTDSVAIKKGAEIEGLSMKRQLEDRLIEASKA